MAVIGSLNINLSAGVATLGKQFNKAAGQATSFAGTVGSAFGKIGGAGSGLVSSLFSVRGALTALGGAAAVAWGAKLFHESMDAIDVSAKAADGLGITTEAITGLQHAANLAGE